MSGMFYYASAFNQPLNFDTSSVTRMSFMFYGANSLSKDNKPGWAPAAWTRGR